MANVTSTLVKFWNDDSVELHNVRLRKEIPPVPPVKANLQVVVGGFETLVYLAYQVKKSSDKSVIVRAIASAIAILFEDVSKNYTGSASAPVKLTGIEDIIDETKEDRTAALVTNFEGAEAVTLEEMDVLMQADTDELGSYFGVLCLCGVKALNAKNRTAFNEKRQNAVRATTIGEPMIFVADSEFLSDSVIQKVYASFNSYLPVRSNMIASTVARIDRSSMGPTLAFTTMFLLLVDQGMSALRIIKEAMVKHPWIRTEFPEILPEVHIAQEAMTSIGKGLPHERCFLKAIHGAAYVPVAYSSIANLTGLCKFVLKETTTTYASYDGGSVTDAQELKLNTIMIARGLMRPVAEDTTEQE